MTRIVLEQIEACALFFCIALSLSLSSSIALSVCVSVVSDIYLVLARSCWTLRRKHRRKPNRRKKSPRGSNTRPNFQLIRSACVNCYRTSRLGGVFLHALSIIADTTRHECATTPWSSSLSSLIYQEPTNTHDCCCPSFLSSIACSLSLSRFLSYHHHPSFLPFLSIFPFIHT